MLLCRSDGSRSPYGKANNGMVSTNGPNGNSGITAGIGRMLKANPFFEITYVMES